MADRLRKGRAMGNLEAVDEDLEGSDDGGVSNFGEISPNYESPLPFTLPQPQIVPVILPNFVSASETLGFGSKPQPLFVNGGLIEKGRAIGNLEPSRILKAAMAATCPISERSRLLQMGAKLVQREWASFVLEVLPYLRNIENDWRFSC